MHPTFPGTPWLLAATLPLFVSSFPSTAQSEGWSTARSLEPARTLGIAASAGGKALFGGGGHPWTGYRDEVDVHDATLGPPEDPCTWTRATLSEARAELSATGVGQDVLFAGGHASGFSMPPSSVVDIYDTLGDSWSTANLSQARIQPAATSVAGYALFAGGDPNPLGNGGSGSDVVDIYEESTGLWTQATLSVGRVNVQATSVGAYALFAGGQLALFGSASNVVDVYDSLVGPPSNPAAWSSVTLPANVSYAAAASAEGKALFGGGTVETSPGIFATSDRVDIYDSSVGPPSNPAAWSVATLSAPRVFLSATSLGDDVFFAGGVTFEPFEQYMDVVDVFDALACTWSTETLSAPRRLAGATSAGGRTLFGGGHDFGWIWSPYGTVDVRKGGDHWYADVAALPPGDGSLASPFPSIQTAIDAAAAGDTVHVAAGDYYEDLVVTKDLSLVSDELHGAVLRSTNSNQPIVTTMNANVEMEGFVVRNGQAPQGGGIFIAGGGVRIASCNFILNRAGGSMSGPGEGGAIYVQSGELHVVDSLFDDNTAFTKGGAIYGSPWVQRCAFLGNRIEGFLPGTTNGSAIFGNPRVENSAFDRNGGTCFFPISAAVPTEIYNSTFINCGGITMGSAAVVRNSIFWAYGGGTGLSGPAPAPDVQYSIVMGGYPGTGNLDLDPRIVAPIRGFAGLRLRPDSPAIDAGDNDAVPCLERGDLDGRPRLMDDPYTLDRGVGAGAPVDMGCFEFQPRIAPRPGAPGSGGSRTVQ